MARRSDFAQKLLDDLRLRKERLAAAGQNSTGRSSTMTGDTYSYFKQTQKGLKEIKKLDVLGSKGGGYTPRRSKGENRSPTSGDSSKQIVSHGRGRGSETMGDLSLALAFALENGGKLRKIDSSGSNSMLGFLHQIGGRSGNFGKMEKGRSVDVHRSSTSHFPTLSPLHLQEISKGAQKLHQILRACSNGINFDSYSIEIGKELLKGAMDLEESLRMLVNLQEASQHMVTPQRKDRIKLLDGDEDEEDDIVKIDEQKRLARPRFSFDKPTRDANGSHKVSKTGLKQRLALTYSSEASNLSHESQASVSSNSQRGSARYTNDLKALIVLSEHKKTSSSSRSKHGMGIPNIIAKLMGLEEIPGAMDSKHQTQTDLSSKQQIDGRSWKKTTAESTKNDELKSKHAENMAPQNGRQKMQQSTKTLDTQNTALGLQADKSTRTRNANLDMMVHDGRPPWKDSENVEGKFAGSPTRKAAAKINKQQQISFQLNKITGSQNSTLENTRRWDNTVIRQQKVAERRETKELFSKHVQPQGAPNSHIIQETTKGLQHKTGQNGSMLQAEQRYANRLFPSNQNMVNNSLQFQQQNLIPKSEHQQEKHQSAKEQTIRQKSQERIQKGTDTISKSSSRCTHEIANLLKQHPHLSQSTHGKRSSTDATDVMPHKGFPDTKHHEIRYGSSNNIKVYMKDSTHRNLDHSVSSTEVEPRSKKAKSNILPFVKENDVYITPIHRKVDNTKVRKRETPRKIDEVMTRRNGNNLVKPLKHPISILQEVKQRRQDKIGSSKRAEQGGAVKHKEVEVPVTMSEKSEENSQLFTVAQQAHKNAEQASSLYNSVRNEGHSFEEPNAPAPNETCQDVIGKGSNDQQDQAPLSIKDQEPEFLQIESGPLIENDERSADLSHTTQLEPQKIFKSSTQQQPLTENENHLKQILTKSQLFLNTVEALFKLNIPIGFLDASGHNYRDEDIRLILDCGYELMRRKGKRQELSVHPFMNTSISSVRIASLDDLVKQLYIDFEKLKSYARNERYECHHAADYLVRMLELDIQTMDPDVNCLWDLGWNDKMYAFIEKDDVIRHVERHVFNGLIGEITRDFLNGSKPN